MADRIIRVLTAVTVLALGAVAAVVSYAHALEAALAHGQSGVTAHLTPLTVDGLVLVAGLVLLDSARCGQRAPVLAWVALTLGIGATVAVNVLYGWKYGPVGAVVAGWPAVALTLSSELLMGLIRRGQGGEKEVSLPCPLDDEKGAQIVRTPGGDGVSAADGIRAGVVAGDNLSLAADTLSAANSGAAGPRFAPVTLTDAKETVSLTGSSAGSAGERDSMSPSVSPAPAPVATADPLLVTARERWSQVLTTGALPSVRQLRREHRIGHPRAVRLREALSRP